MIGGWAVVLSALVYLCLLFAVAHWGDHSGSRMMRGPARATIYALALAVYCTSWTFFGSVGLASRSGLDFLTIYIGPVLVIGLGHRLVARVVRIAKAQNITSIADFVAARYGKSERVAAIVCADRARRRRALYRAAAQSRVGLAQRVPGGGRGRRHRAPGAGLRRPRPRRRAGARRLRGRVRHAPHRRDRAPGRADAGDRARIGRQARRLPDRRRLRDLLDVRRPRRDHEPASPSGAATSSSSPAPRSPAPSSR